MSIGLKIKEFRKRRGLTQKQLGDRCGIADSNIRKYENGQQNPKIETLRKIADALNAIVIENNGQFDLIDEQQTIVKQISHITANDLMTYPTLEQTLSNYVKELLSCYQADFKPITDKFFKESDLNYRSEVYNNIIHHVDVRVINGQPIFDIYPLITFSLNSDSVDNNLLKKYTLLNSKGQNKLIEYAKDLAKIPEYVNQNKDTFKLLSVHVHPYADQNEKEQNNNTDITNDDQE